jgi:hypothetical protein
MPGVPAEPRNTDIDWDLVRRNASAWTLRQISHHVAPLQARVYRERFNTFWCVLKDSAPFLYEEWPLVLPGAKVKIEADIRPPGASEIFIEPELPSWGVKKCEISILLTNGEYLEFSFQAVQQAEVGEESLVPGWRHIRARALVSTKFICYGDFVARIQERNELESFWAALKAVLAEYCTHVSAVQMEDLLVDARADFLGLMNDGARPKSPALGLLEAEPGR